MYGEGHFSSAHQSLRVVISCQSSVVVGAKEWEGKGGAPPLYMVALHCTVLCHCASDRVQLSLVLPSPAVRCVGLPLVEIVYCKRR